MTVTCPACATENADAAKFCQECATPLAAAAGAAERLERRVVSVLFADLAGFTSRSESLDVEDVEGFLSPYLAVLRSEVERTGGHVAKFTGDGVMALFGAVVAHEDDPERAVRAGLGICRCVADMSDADLHVRVGVTSGEALISYGVAGAVDAVGDVVNTAARLESSAPLDGVLVEKRTHRATKLAIRYQAADAVVAKGKAKPVEAWVAVAPRSIVPEQMRVDGMPLIGRVAEAGVLRDALDRSRREPAAQLVSITGEPGIGKTRLVEELSGYVEELLELITWRRGRSLAYGEGVAFWALGEMVKAQAGILESDSAQVADAKLTEAVVGLVVGAQDRDWVVRHLRPLVGLEEQAGSSRVEAFAAWRRFFEALAEHGPTVLLFEDIHWADDALLEFIDLLADRAGALPLLIVCTARPELFERRPSWGGSKANASTISLTPLSSDETARLLAALLDQALLPADVQQALLGRSEGNPLYAQEYVRMLQDHGLLIESKRGWTLTGTVDDLPESIQGIIAARLDTLTREQKSFIQDASVIGKTAWIGAACTLSERNAWEAEELLDSLERKQFVQRLRRSSISGEIEFAFTHALTRDVAYSQIRRADRAQKHEVAAQWVERLSGERDDKAELLADHYHNALALRRQLGDDVSHLEPHARAAFAVAAVQAHAVYAYEAAARHYRAALTLTPNNDLVAVAELQLGIARVLTSDGSADGRTLHAALAAQIAVEDWEAAAKAEHMLATWHMSHVDRGNAASSHLRRGADYAARVGSSAAVMFEIAGAQAGHFLVDERPEEAVALTNRMIPFAELAGFSIPRAQLLSYRGSARVDLGDYNGIADMEESARILARHADPATAKTYGNLADSARSLGDMAGADNAYEAAARWAQRFALRQIADWITIEQAYQAYHAADWRTAEDLLDEVQTTGVMIQNGIRITRCRISLARGDLTGALEDAGRFAVFAETGSGEDLSHALVLRALCDAARDRQAEALASCQQLLARGQDSHGMAHRSIELCDIAPILANAARHSEIREVADRLPETNRWRDALRAVADERYAAAAALYEHIGSQPLAADAHLLAARQAAQEGRIADTHRHAEAVLSFAAETGATLYEERAGLFVQANAQQCIRRRT